MVSQSRNAETETQSESKTSAPLTVYFKAMNDASKLDSLMLDESVPLPSFDPDVYIYDVSIEYPISNLTPIASAKGGAKVTIDVPPLVAGEVNEIKISVECEYGRVREYLIRVKLAAVESEIASESISESVAEATTLAEESLTETYISTETEKESTENYISCASSLGIYPLVILASISCLFIKKIKNC